MKRVLLAVIISCAVIAAPVCASPQIHVEEPTYDFGSILEGFAVSHVFTIVNLGNKTLEIDRVAASCGCTTTALETDRLAPGASVDLEVLVDTAGFGGRISKSIYLYTNDPEYADSHASNRPRFTLRVTGDVLKAQPYHTSISDMNYLFYVLVDLREPVAYDEAHLLGSINVPAAQLLEWSENVPTDAFLVLYDQEGQFSKQAADDLTSAGFSTVYYTLGGLDEWMRWYETFLIQPTLENLLLPGREGRIRLSCPSDDLLCTEVEQVRYLAYVLVDLRDPADYVTSHLLGAINIPYTTITGQLDTLPKDVLVILYDQANEQSDAVVQMLQNAGYNQARSLLGGLDEWVRQFGERFVVDDPY